MYIILPLLLVLIALVFNKGIRINSVAIFIIATILSMLTILYHTVFPFTLISTGQMGLSFLIVVMFVGALPKGSTIKKRLRNVRKEYAIIAMIMLIPHSLLNIYDFFLGYNYLEIFGLMSMFFVLLLGITSFNTVKQSIKTSSWLRIHRLAYVLYLLLYLHILEVCTFDSLIAYTIIFGAYLFMKLYNYKFHKYKLLYSSFLTIVVMSGSVLLLYDIEEYNYEYYDIVEGNEFTDGVYYGEAKGYKNKTTSVYVTIENNVIISVVLNDVGGTATVADGLYLDAAYDVAYDIVLNNRTDIDAVSGATATSISVNEAVIDALLKAKR